MPRKLQHALIALTVLFGIGVILIWSLTPKPKRFEAIPGLPMLAQDGKEFVDEQVGLRFTPPAEWVMQARSTEAPKHRAERRLVKYKRASPSLPPAWLRVHITDDTDGISSVELLKQRQPPEGDWKPLGEVEEDLTIGGLPAARRTYSAQFNSEGEGNRQYHCELVIVKRGGRFFEFNGTYPVGDERAQQDIRLAMESVLFLPE